MALASSLVSLRQRWNEPAVFQTTTMPQTNLWTSLLCLLVLVLASSSHGFLISNMKQCCRRISEHGPASFGILRQDSPSSRSSTCLFYIDEDEDKEKLKVITPSSDEKEEKDDRALRATRAVLWLIIDFLTNIITVFFYVTAGTALMGLFLNIFGYGYTITKDEGIHIDTIRQLRTDRQFRREYHRISETKPPTQLPE